MDGFKKPYICPARVTLKDGTPTDEVLLQITLTECKDKRLDAYIRKDNGEVYYQAAFTKEFNKKDGKFTDQGYFVDIAEAKQQFLTFLDTRKEKFDPERFKNSTGISRALLVPKEGSYFQLCLINIL